MGVPKTFEVAVEAPVVVVPAGPPEAESTLFLNNFDQHVFFNTDLGFYFGAVPELGDVLGLLRDGLAKVLLPYRFLAGRYRVNEEKCRLEINSNAAGVPFAAAECNVALGELGDLSYQNPALKKLFLYTDGIRCIEDIPLLTVQVTKFSCGGLSICFCASHVALDGGSLVKFLKDFANLVRGESEVVNANSDRSFLRARTPLQISYSHTELTATLDVPAKLFFSPAHYDRNAPPVPPGFTTKTFRFTPGMLKSLKDKVVAESGGSIKFCSAFEVLSALIWQTRTRALKMELHEPSKLFLVISFRKQLEEFIPAGFVGNTAICAPCIDVTAEDVCSGNLAFCVEKVQQTKNSVTEEYVRSVVDWCEVNHGITNLPGGILVTTWTKLGFEEVDFGFGKPRYVAPLINPRHDFVTLVSNCRGDGGIDVYIGMLEHQQMEVFEKLFVA